MNKISNPKFLIVVLFLIAAAFIYSFSLNFCDNKVNDFFIKIHAYVVNKKAPDNVVLVVIDDKSLKKIEWPWKRSLFTDIFNFLEFESGAKSIVFQNLVVFPDSYNPDSDEIFFNSLLNYNTLINSYVLLNSNLAGDVLPSEYMELFESKSHVKITDKRNKWGYNPYKGVVKLPKTFLLNAKNLAFSFIPEDKDEIVRNYMPIVQLDKKLLPSLALSAYSMYTGINEYELYDNYLCSADGCKTLKVPVMMKKGKDYIGNSVVGTSTYINWYKPIGEYYSHKAYSAVDILNSYYDLKLGKTPKINPEEFKDKIVIVGLNADKNVWEQLSETPVLKRQADIDVHASMIDNMLKNEYLTIKVNNYTFLITVIFSLFIIFGFRNFKYNLIFTSLLSVIYFIYYLFEYFNYTYISPVTPIIIMFSVAVFKKIFIIITTDKTTEMIKHAMGKYISKDVMKRVLSNLDKLKLGGTRTNATILFVDIRNFTQISEKLSPSDVTSVLNEYFSVIEPVIGKYHGIINKYMGDGVLAIFGEPIKNENHAKDAVFCGIEIIEKIKVLKEKLLAEGKPKIEVGIGINTGEVFAGNIGTEERLEYTIIGDNVNLAYRIEALNQVLKTQFLISEYTYETVKDIVDVVKLTQVNIKGKSKPIDIYEVLAIKKNDE